MLFIASIVLSSLAATGAAAGSEKVPGTVGAATHREAKVALHRAESALRQPGRGDLTMLLSDLAIALPRLRGEDARLATALLARPTDGRKDPELNGYAVREAAPFCSAHFCVHYVRRTRDAPSLQDRDGDGAPNYVEMVSNQAEKSYRVEVGQMGWRRPRSDRGRGGSNKTDIYLSQIGQGFYGYAATDPGQATNRFPRRRSRYTYMVIDDNFSRAEFGAPPRGTAAVTIAHEFNHVLQFTYDVLQDPWMDESTATWMENEVFPNVDDYFNYVRGWARESRVPLTSAGFPKLYGSAVWLQWLAERHGQRVVRSAWERTQAIKPAGFSVRAFNSAIKSTSRSNFARSFARFAANTAEWRVNRRFPEGFRFPRVRRSGHLVPGRSMRRQLHHTGYQLLRVPVPAGNPRALRLAAWIAPDTRAAFALVGLGAKGAKKRTVTRLRFLTEGGKRAVTLSRPGRFRRITAVMVNADARQDGFGPFGWRYTRDRVPFRARVGYRR